MTQEEEIRALLEAVAKAREAASKSYEFSNGEDQNTYAYAALLAVIKVGELALAALGTAEDWQ